jgi:hypothetical protein
MIDDELSRAVEAKGCGLIEGQYIDISLGILRKVSKILRPVLVPGFESR